MTTDYPIGEAMTEAFTGTVSVGASWLRARAATIRAEAQR
jgi:hypothetical protein